MNEDVVEHIHPPSLPFDPYEKIFRWCDETCDKLKFLRNISGVCKDLK